MGDPITELTMALEVNYFQLNRAEYFLPVAIKIPRTERDRLNLYGKALLAMTIANFGDAERSQLVLRNIMQYKDETNSIKREPWQKQADGSLLASQVMVGTNAEFGFGHGKGVGPMWNWGEPQRQGPKMGPGNKVRPVSPGTDS